MTFYSRIFFYIAIAIHINHNPINITFLVILNNYLFVITLGRGEDVVLTKQNLRKK